MVSGVVLRLKCIWILLLKMVFGEGWFSCSLRLKMWCRLCLLFFLDGLMLILLLVVEFSVVDISLKLLFGILWCMWVLSCVWGCCVSYICMVWIWCCMRLVFFCVMVMCMWFVGLVMR